MSAFVGNVQRAFRGCMFRVTADLLLAIDDSRSAHERVGDDALFDCIALRWTRTDETHLTPQCRGRADWPQARGPDRRFSQRGKGRAQQIERLRLPVVAFVVLEVSIGPGGVCPARISSGSWLSIPFCCRSMTPPTSKTTMRGPFTRSAARSVPLPSFSSEVTRTTCAASRLKPGSGTTADCHCHSAKAEQTTSEATRKWRSGFTAAGEN